MQNSPARLPDVGLGPRVGLPGRRQPAGYGTSWSVLFSSTSGRSGPSTESISPFSIHEPPVRSSEVSIWKAAGGVEEQMYSPQCLKNPFEKG